MNRITLLVLALAFASSSLYAQNNFFVKFGSPHDEVVNFLEARHNVSIDVLTRVEIDVTSDGKQVSYEFDEEGKLYRISVEEEIYSKKHARNTMTGYEEFFKTKGANIQEVSDPDAERHFEVYYGNSLNEIVELTDNDSPKQIKVRMVSTDLKHKKKKKTEVSTNY